jgi:hypothetical protein
MKDYWIFALIANLLGITSRFANGYIRSRLIKRMIMQKRPKPDVCHHKIIKKEYIAKAIDQSIAPQQKAIAPKPITEPDVVILNNDEKQNCNKRSKQKLMSRL